MSESFTDADVKATREDWTVTTYADGFGIWHCKVATTAGWGNAGTRDIAKHIGAIRARARRAITREIQARQAAPMGKLRLVVAYSRQYSTGPTYSITFKEA
jgi:1,4-dihydroxy-2-naphthoyl-CoA synthase